MKAREEAVAEKLLHGDCGSFTPDEVEALKAIAQTFLGFAALGRAASVVRRSLTFVGWGVALYLAAKAGFIGWIHGVMAK